MSCFFASLITRASAMFRQASYISVASTHKYKTDKQFDNNSTLKTGMKEGGQICVRMIKLLKLESILDE